jgi:hypothetical protein
MAEQGHATVKSEKLRGHGISDRIHVPERRFGNPVLTTWRSHHAQFGRGPDRLRPRAKYGRSSAGRRERDDHPLAACVSQSAEPRRRLRVHERSF